MEDYKLLYMIAEGPLGPTLLVQDKLSGEKCVIKQVQCTDYTQAQLAYNQTLKLQLLNRHPSNCRYLQFFVHWDREAHAVYVCTVTRYQELGNLTSYIENQRSKNEAVDEQLLIEWMRQLASAIDHAHSNQILHRNIKPTNIFLSSSTTLLLGDYTVPVVMGNLTKVMMKRGGSLRWLSPEELAVVNKKCNREGGGGVGSEKSDIWSLGCILLELATSSFMEGSHYSVLLHRLHKDPNVLDEAMDKVKKIYSSDLCQLLESCLRRSCEQRPTISDILKSSVLHIISSTPSSEAHDDSTASSVVLANNDTSSSGMSEEEEPPCELD